MPAIAYSFDLNNRFWRKALWISAVTLTLGLCLLTPKRVLAEELRAELLANQSDVTLISEVKPVAKMPVKMVADVQRIQHMPVWASALSEAELFHDELPQSSTRKLV